MFDSELNHQDHAVEDVDSSTLSAELGEEVDEIERVAVRTLVRLCTDRSESSEVWVKDDWLRTMGGGRLTSGEDTWEDVGGVTGSGGDSEEVGRVERVRLSRNGGGRRWVWRRCRGPKRAGGGRSGSVMASDSEWRAGDGGLDVVDGVGESQRRTGRRTAGGMSVRRASRRSVRDGREQAIFDLTSQSRITHQCAFLLSCLQGLQSRTVRALLAALALTDGAQRSAILKPSRPPQSWAR